MPENFLRGFLIFTLCVGGTLSYLILSSRWHGWVLASAIFLSMYGTSTVARQADSVAFLSNKLPPGMIRAIFVQGAIAAALFAPLAVLALGKWRAASLRAPMPPAAPLKPASCPKPQVTAKTVLACSVCRYAIAIGKLPVDLRMKSASLEGREDKGSTGRSMTLAFLLNMAHRRWPKVACSVASSWPEN